MRTILFFLLQFTIVAFLHSQVKISGKVIDAKTNERLAFVNILLNGKDHYGTMSNEQGVFEMLIPPNTKWPCSLTVSLLGYETKDVRITQNTKSLTIRLSTLPVCIDAVAIKEKNDLNKAQEILDSAYQKINKNMAFKYRKKDDSSFQKENILPFTFYTRNYVSFNKKYFFSEEMIVDISRKNGVKYDTVLAYKLHVDEAFVLNHEKLDYYHPNLVIASTGKNGLFYAYKKKKHAFIDTVFEKDGHIIYVIVVSKKLNKQSYRALMDSVKIDPTWAAQHEDAFNDAVHHKLKLYKYWIDKTDNYKLLKGELLAGQLNIVYGLYVMNRLYKKYNGKMYPYHLQVFTKSSIGDTRFSESLLVHINDSINIYEPKSIRNIYLNELGNNYVYKKNTVYGSWEQYNTLAEDSLAREVMKDIVLEKK